MPRTTAPYNYPLYYFLRDLIGITILSPFVYLMVRWGKWWYICVFSALALAGLLPSFPGLRSSALLFFSAGACLSVWGYNFYEFALNRWKTASVIAVILLVLGLFAQGRWSDIISVVFTLVGVYALAGITAWLTGRFNLKAASWLIGSFFFVYAAHEGLYILTGVSWLLKQIIPEITCWWMLLEYILNIVITLGVCVGLYILIDRYLPSLSVLTGKLHRSNKPFWENMRN